MKAGRPSVKKIEQNINKGKDRKKDELNRRTDKLLKRRSTNKEQPQVSRTQSNPF